jgi:hypothetical protein
VSVPDRSAVRAVGLANIVEAQYSFNALLQ